MEKLMLGLATTGVGMLVVFFGLVILIVCIYVLTMVTGRKKPAKKAPAPHPAQKAAPAPVPAPVAEEPAGPADDTQLIAVLTAAVAAIWESEGSQDSGFVVRRVRRVQSSAARARAARNEQIYSHY